MKVVLVVAVVRVVYYTLLVMLEVYFAFCYISGGDSVGMVFGVRIVGAINRGVRCCNSFGDGDFDSMYCW